MLINPSGLFKIEPCRHNMKIFNQALYYDGKWWDICSFCTAIREKDGMWKSMRTLEILPNQG